MRIDKPETISGLSGWVRKTTFTVLLISTRVLELTKKSLYMNNINIYYGEEGRKALILRKNKKQSE